MLFASLLVSPLASEGIRWLLWCLKTKRCLTVLLSTYQLYIKSRQRRMRIRKGKRLSQSVLKNLCIRCFLPLMAQGIFLPFSPADYIAQLSSCCHHPTFLGLLRSLLQVILQCMALQSAIWKSPPGTLPYMCELKPSKIKYWFMAKTI